MAKFSLTLVLYVSLVLALAVSSNANTLDSHRRDHANLNRLIKKRAPVPLPQGIGNIFGGAGAQPTPQAQAASSTPAEPTGNSATAAGNTPTVPANSATNAASTPAASPSTTNSGGLLGSIVGGILPTGSSSTTPASSTASSTGTSSTHQSSSTPAPAVPSQPPTTPTNQDPTTSFDIVTSSTVPSPSQTSTTSSSSGMSHTAMTILIVIAASIGGSVIIWTIIRKWKFRPSSNFEDRMQPIDWQPGTGGEDDTGLPGQRRRLSAASSFHSGSNHGDDHRGQAGGHGTSPLNPIPDHDFTAGATNFAPVGGYADLARGPSPQPMMQELGRGPSMNTHYQYDQQYGVPLHHGYNAHGY